MPYIIGFIVGLLAGAAVALVQAAIIVFILNIVGIPTLAALTIWQVFGLIAVFDVIIFPMSWAIMAT